jgi:hypothetical protein
MFTQKTEVEHLLLKIHLLRWDYFGKFGCI